MEVVKDTYFKPYILAAGDLTYKFVLSTLFPFYLGGVWCIVLNKHPIKCVCIYEKTRGKNGENTFLLQVTSVTSASATYRQTG